MRRLCFPLLLAAAPLFAQVGREPYRAAYQAWRDAAPTLEQDAATPNPEFSTKVQAATEAAEKFLAARADYIAASRPDAAEQIEWASRPLIHPEALLTTRPEVQSMLTRAGEFLNSSINNFSTVKDPAIQQVRQAMERERAALNALNQSLSARPAAVAELVGQADDAEVLRATVARSLANGVTATKALADRIRAEATSWTTYYRDLNEGAASTARVSGTNPAPAAAPAKQVLTPRPSPAGQTPLSRYVGTWAYPARNGIFLGTQPQTAELLVREENGTMSGILVMKFIVPAGRNADLRVDFQGTIQQSRKQTFSLTTPEGITGTIELIPGSAINLLEVNFQTAPNGTKVTNANFVLVKR